MSLELIIGLLGVLGLGCLWAAAKNLSRTPKRRPVRAGVEGFIGLILLGVTALGTSVAVNLHSYDRLTKEKVVARIGFTKTGHQQFVAELELLDRNERHTYQMKGDEWEISARIIKWHPRAVVLGLDTQYRLERLGVDFFDLEQARNEKRTIYDVHNDDGLDITTIFDENPQWIPWKDTAFKSKGVQSMVDGGRFEISVGTGGLIVRAINEKALDATQN